MSLRDSHEASRPSTDPELELELNSEGGTFSGFVAEDDSPNSFDHFYELTGLSKDEWHLDKESLTVRMWQQSKRTDNGDRDLVWLRSYGGKLIRSDRPELTQEDIASLLSIGRRYPKTRYKKVKEQTRVAVVTDLQVGKRDRLGGTPELIARVANTFDKLSDVMAENPSKRALIADPGDIIEGFENTSSQQFTNDLSLPEQLRVARSILTDIVTGIASKHDHTTVATCPSNHGAWRRGKGSLGRPGDDFGIDVHMSVKEALARDPRYQNVEWVIPESLWEEITYVEEYGHEIALVHGHQARNGKFEDFWRKQAGTFSKAHSTDIVISGHFHTFVAQALGINSKGNERLHVQSSTMDNGSSWWSNISGDMSKPGIVTFLIDEDGWHDLRFISSDI